MPFLFKKIAAALAPLWAAPSKSAKIDGKMDVHGLWCLVKYSIKEPAVRVSDHASAAGKTEPNKAYSSESQG